MGCYTNKSDMFPRTDKDIKTWVICSQELLNQQNMPM